MNIIIRLQHLPWSANAWDIRNFFCGLSIPEGGVNIVGGPLGDAFIAFSTDEDARLAMMRDRELIAGTQIRLLLSSRAEMLKVIDSIRNQSTSILPASEAVLIKSSAVTGFGSDNERFAVNKQTLNNPTTFQQRDEVKKPLAETINIDIVPSSLNSSTSYSTISEHYRSNSCEPDKSCLRYGESKKTTTQRDESNGRICIEYIDRGPNCNKDIRGWIHNTNLSRGRSHDESINRNRTQSHQQSHYKNRNRSSERNRDRSRDRSNDCIRDRSRDRSRERGRDRNRHRNWNDDHEYDRNSHQSRNNYNNRIDNKNSNTKGSVDTQSKANDQYISPWCVPINSLYQSNTNWNNNMSSAIDNINYINANNAMVNQTQKQLANLLSLFNNITSNANNNLEFNNIQTNKTEQNGMNIVKSTIPGIFIDNSGLSNLSTQYTQSCSIDGSTQDSNKYADTNPYEKMYPGVFAKLTANVNECSQNQSPPIRQESHSRSHEYRVKYNSTFNYCVKLNNMCTSTTYSDIRKFFSGLNIPHNGIRLLNDSQGSRMGIAYVQFSQESSVQQALLKSNTILNDKLIKINKPTNEDYEEMKSSFRLTTLQKRDKSVSDTENKESSTKRHFSPEQIHSHYKKYYKPYNVLYIDEMPIQTTECDVMKMFNSYTLYDMLLMENPDNRRESMAFVCFTREKDAEAAYNETNRHHIGNRHVRVLPATIEAMNAAKERIRLSNEQTHKDDETTVIKDNQDSDVNERRNNNLHSNLIEDDNINGNCNNERNKDIYNNNDKHIEKLRNNNNEDDLTNRIDQWDQNCNNRYNTKSSEDGNVANNFVILKNCDYSTHSNDIIKLFMTENLQSKYVEAIRNERQRPTGEFIVELNNAKDAETAVQYFHNIQFRRRGLRVHPITPQEISNRFGKPFLGFMPSRHNENISYDDNYINRETLGNFHINSLNTSTTMSRLNNRNNSEGNRDRNQLMRRKFARPGCVIAMENVPYKATIIDVLKFFNEFNLTPDDVIRRYNNIGMPTGDVRVAFPTQEMAQAAIRSRRRHQIFKHDVQLHIIQNHDSKRI